MENSNEFSPIERAAMEQSPSDETKIRHNFMAESDFIDEIEKTAGKVDRIVTGVGISGNIYVTGGDDPCKDKIATLADTVTKEVAAAAGGIVIDGVFSKKHINLLKSIDQECSLEDLIDLRRRINSANKILK